MKTNTPFQDTIMDFADKLQVETGASPVKNLLDASTLILTTITRHALAGTDHLLHPDHSSIEKSSVGACFMAACSAPIAYTLHEQNSLIDVKKLMTSAGKNIFQNYSDADQSVIVDKGIMLFQEIIQAARENVKLEEWMISIHSVTTKYILTKGDTEYVELFAPLYLVLLMATQQFNIEIKSNRES
jgi:hypothetical protein